MGEGRGDGRRGRAKRQYQLLAATLNPLNPSTNKRRQPARPIDRVLNARPIRIHLNNGPTNQPFTKQIPSKSLYFR